MGRNLLDGLPVGTHLSVGTRRYALFTLPDFIRILRATIPENDIEAYLPFGIIRRDSRDGEYQHLIFNSIVPFTVSPTKVIIRGEALCQRWDSDFKRATGEKEMCPGCLAIARAIALRLE